MQCNVRKSCAGDRTAALILTKVMHLHSVISKSCTLLTSFLLLGYLVCKIFSMFWSTPCSSYARLQSISFSCWLTTNPNLQLAPHAIKQLPGQYQWQSTNWGESPPPSPGAWRPQRALGQRDQSSAAPQAGETRASQFSGLSRCLLLPKTLLCGGAASRRRTIWCFSRRGDLRSWVRAASHARAICISLIYRSLLGTC